MSLKVIKLVLILALMSCEHNITHGNQPSETSVLDNLQASKASKEEVLNQLGSPVFTSDYQYKTWYYITVNQKRSAFLPSKIKSEEVVQITFDENDKVTKILKTRNNVKEIVFSKDVTRAGKGDGEFELMLKNTSRFNKSQKKSSGQS
jgi:outer membrane protein assembly factor BamE (lipoprotein component of BamABCDE complex)